MSPIELKKLRELSKLFEDGNAGYKEIRELSNLLALMNNNNELEENRIGNKTKLITKNFNKETVL